MPLYLCCYDYDTGGIWLYVDGASPDDIQARHPALIVIETRPPWLSDEFNDTLLKKASDPFWTSWLADLDRSYAAEQLSKGDIRTQKSGA